MRGSVTVKQIQNSDKIAINRYGIPSIVLMENAGRAVAEEVKKSLRGKKKARVCVVCGPGNNAGDGFVAARHLINAGINTKVLLFGKSQQLKRDAAVNYRILKKLKYPIIECRGTTNLAGIQNFVSLHFDIARADIVVDAIFGVGLNREITEPFRSAIEAVNRKAKYVVAVDIPSGLDGTTGAVYSACVKADKTVTFTFLKKGFFRNHGPRQTGKIIVVDIGIPLRLKTQGLMTVSNQNIDQVIRILKKQMRDLPDPSVTLVGKKWKDPFLVLVSCILSLRTKDKTTLPASERLFRVASTPGEMLRITPEEIEKLIYPVGFYRTKARVILGICHDVLEKFAGRVPKDIDTLLTMKGVGRKTANLVLTEGFGLPGICVDTHVHRISNRFGYVRTKTPYDTEMILRKKLPPRHWIDYNALLVTWGQNVCKPISPLCSRCSIRIYCSRYGTGKSR